MAGRCSCGRGVDCPSPVAHPLDDAGPEAATTDSRLLSRWWKQWPDAGILIATGGPARLLVLRVQGDAGRQALAELEREFKPLPHTPRARCGDDLDYYFRLSSAEPWPQTGADLAGRPLRIVTDGLVLDPPSVDAAGRACVWEVSPNFADPKPAPAWLLDLIDGHLAADAAPAPDPTPAAVPPTDAHEDVIDDEVAAAVPEPSRKAPKRRKKNVTPELPAHPPAAPPCEGTRLPEAGAGDALDNDASATTTDEDLILDAEFAALVPPRSDEELARLEQSLLDEGRERDPLVVWKGHRILLEGYGRYALCRKHALKYDTVELYFATREEVCRWIIDNQLARRNLTPEGYAYLRRRRYLCEKQPHGGGTNRHPQPQAGPSEPSGNSCHSARTDAKLARDFNVSARTVRADAEFARAVDTLADNCGPDVRGQILSRRVRLSRRAVLDLAAQTPEKQRKALQDAAAGRKAAGAGRGKGKKAQAGAKGKEATVTPPTESVPLAQFLEERLGKEEAITVLRGALGHLQHQPVPGPSAGRPRSRRPVPA